MHAPPSSPYITPVGAARLREELDQLWRHTRPEVTRALADAAAEGDRSENAEYIYRKRQLAGIDRRVRYLRKRLAVIKIVDSPPDDPARVFFGAWIRLEDEQGHGVEYRIVGADEFDTHRDYISFDSPMARALMRRMTGDEISVEMPGGRASFTITGVRYRESE
ncbi:MAG: transcription elongation factor GreB [Gammaproteobacteria bacterium]